MKSAPADGLIFTDLPDAKLGPISAVQKSLGRRIRNFVADKRVVFHSFRHNFRDAMREANIPDEVAGALGGWTEGKQSAMAGYGRGHSEKALAEWMAKIAYHGLALQHLFIDQMLPEDSNK